MEKEWVKIYATGKLHEAEMIKGLLEEHGIHSVVINKQDSSYLAFGEAEVYVNREYALMAINVINKKTE